MIDVLEHWMQLSPNSKVEHVNYEPYVTNIF